MKFLVIFLCFFLSGCSFQRLDVQTQYLTPESLASFHIGTPDPRLHAPLIGQRLLIQWSLCEHEIEGEDTLLNIKIRFRNHQEKEIQVPIISKKGAYLYKVEGDLYCQTRGILTYFIQIQNDTGVIEAWKHPLWSELIQF